MSLYDYLVLFPVFIGSLTSIVIFFLVKRIAGAAGGLFAALMFAVSPPILERGNLGWFKSEPLGIFLFVVSAYIFLTLLDSDMSSRQRVLRGILAGFLLGYANTAWGGAEYFTAAFGLFFIVLPFLDLDLSKLAITGLFFTAGDIFGSAIFPRPGVGVVTSAEGLAIIGGTLFIMVANWLKGWVKPDDFKKTLVKVMFGAALAAVALVSFGSVSALSARYLSVIFPWVRSGNPLVESVAEQALPTGSDYFSSYLLLLLLGIFGAVIAFRRRNPATVFALVIRNHTDLRLGGLLASSGLLLDSLRASRGDRVRRARVLADEALLILDGQAQAHLQLRERDARGLLGGVHSAACIPGEHILDSQPRPVHDQEAWSATRAPPTTESASPTEGRSSPTLS